MNDLICFAERHPWWTLVYLVVASSVLNGLVKIRWTRRG